WYTGGGHTSESYTEPLFLKHIEGGILWAAGASDDAVAPTKKVDAKQP
ncbi:MAG: Trehalose utilization, partial [Planctomycetota bacterium]